VINEVYSDSRASIGQVVSQAELVGKLYSDNINYQNKLSIYCSQFAWSFQMSVIMKICDVTVAVVMKFHFWIYRSFFCLQIRITIFHLQILSHVCCNNDENNPCFNVIRHLSLCNYREVSEKQHSGTLHISTTTVPTLACCDTSTLPS